MGMRSLPCCLLAVLPLHALLIALLNTYMQAHRLQDAAA
jgi:hypothetical protein